MKPEIIYLYPIFFSFSWWLESVTVFELKTINKQQKTLTVLEDRLHSLPDSELQVRNVLRNTDQHICLILWMLCCALNSEKIRVWVIYILLFIMAYLSSKISVKCKHDSNYLKLLPRHRKKITLKIYLLFHCRLDILRRKQRQLQIITTRLHISIHFGHCFITDILQIYISEQKIVIQ